jgi:hypothetical protein
VFLKKKKKFKKTAAFSRSCRPSRRRGERWFDFFGQKLGVRPENLKKRRKKKKKKRKKTFASFFEKTGKTTKTALGNDPARRFSLGKG